MELSGTLGKNQNAIREGYALASRHPLISPLPEVVISSRGLAFHLHAKSWFSICAEASSPEHRLADRRGEREPMVTVWPNLRRRANVEEWAYVFARLRLHVALNHLDPGQTDLSWHMAAWCRAEQLLMHAGVGQRPEEITRVPVDLPRGNETELAAHLNEQPLRPEIAGLSLGVAGQRFWHFASKFEISGRLRAQRASALAEGIRTAVAQAVRASAGLSNASESACPTATAVSRARDWIVAEYPLLAALASSFTLIEDELICKEMSIPVAAICDDAREVYVNPRAGLSEAEARFVLAHEFLHVGLRHSVRQQDRDPWLWNVACDFIINAWLLEMKLGEPPAGIGFLHDSELKDCSAEEIYERITSNLGLLQKLAGARAISTMNGDSCDILKAPRETSGSRAGGLDLDGFYRRSLREGMSRHQDLGQDPLPFTFVKDAQSL